MSEENEQVIDDGLEIISDEPESSDEQHKHSVSRLKVFEACPYLFKATYIDRRKGETSPIMLVGRVVHDVLLSYASHCIAKKVEHDYESWEAMVWPSLKKENLPPEYYDSVFEMVKQFCESHTIDLESVYGCEQKVAINRNFEEVDWMAPDVWFRGIMDFVQMDKNQRYCKIIDYKTGFSMKADEFQLKIYAWLMKKLYPSLVDFELVFDFVRFDFQKDFSITEDEIEGIEKKIMSRIEHVEAEKKFEPTIGSHCEYCPFWFACPAMRPETDRLIRGPKSQEEAVAIALECEKHSRLLGEGRKVLKAYCDINGPLSAGGRIYQFKASKKWEFENLGELAKELIKFNINLLDYVNIDTRKFKKLFGNDFVDRVVARLGKKKVSVTFTTAKDSGEDSE